MVKELMPNSFTLKAAQTPIKKDGFKTLVIHFQSGML